MVWTRPNDNGIDILTLPVPAASISAEPDKPIESVDCPTCRGGGMWREPLLLLAIVGVLALWFRDVESRTETQRTDARFDIAIRGHGHFQVLRPDGTFAYTRFGRFSLNDRGQLVTAEGYSVQPPVSIPDDTQSVTIGADGTVSVVRLSAPNAATVVGNLNAVLFSDPEALAAIEPGRPYYSETLESGTPIVLTPGTQGVGEIRQGWLEGTAWFSDSSFLKLTVGLSLVLLARLVIEMRRQRRQVEALVDQLRRPAAVNVQAEKNAA